ncbi:MAG: tyrosine-type recombinase/integrase [Ktedonobacteraceae bacterium]
MDIYQIDAIASAVVEKLSPKCSVIFDELCLKFLEHRRHKRSFRMDESRMRNYLLPAFGGMTLSDITPFLVADLHKKIGKDHPYQANRVVQQLSCMFRLAQSWRMFPRDGENPGMATDLYPEISRDRFLTEQEIERASVHINSCRKQHYRVLFWLFLLTALRHDELVGAKWGDIDWENWLFKLPAKRSKNGKPHFVPLPAEALALFHRLPQRGEYIFSTDGAKPLNCTAVWKAWNRVRIKAGLSDVRIHDLRRTVGSLLAQSGEPLPLIADLLNHADMKSTLIYARIYKPQVRIALQQHASRIARFIPRHI